LRKKQTPEIRTSAEETREAARTAVREGTGVPSVSRDIARAVTNSVTDAVRSGEDPDLALEAAARGLDQAAAGE
jgi:hypothetical protein